MRTGLSVSIVAHIVLLTIGLINLGFTEPLTPAVESISVDLVPVEEFSNIRAGQLDSQIVETETPSIVEDDQVAELAQPTGNTEQDQVTPSPADIPTRGRALAALAAGVGRADAGGSDGTDGPDRAGGRGPARRVPAP